MDNHNNHDPTTQHAPTLTLLKRLQDDNTNPINTTTTYTPLDDRLAFEILLESSGHVQLACDKLTRLTGAKVTQGQLLDIIRPRLPDLKEYMEAVATLQLFSLMPTLAKKLAESLDGLEPAEAVDSYMQLMKLVSLKTDTVKMDVTLRNELVWNKLPPELKQLYMQQELESDVNANANEAAS